MKRATMAIAFIRCGSVALTLSLGACACCRDWFRPARQTDSRTFGRQGAAPALPPHPLTWDEFVATQRSRGLPMATLEKRFRVADANRDSILTPEEIQRHRVAAAQNKSQRG
jgi:hypothetical protein